MFVPSVDLDQFAEEDREIEIHQSRSMAQKVQAQLKQILQDEGYGATFTEEQVMELILQVSLFLSLKLFQCHQFIVSYSNVQVPSCLLSNLCFTCFPFRVLERFGFHKSSTNLVPNGAMMVGLIFILPSVEQILNV